MQCEGMRAKLGALLDEYDGLRRAAAARKQQAQDDEAAFLDGFARLRRRREPIARGIAWVVASAAPFLIALAFVFALAKTGLLAATPAAPVPKGAIPVSAAALASALLVFLLCWLVVRPFVLRVSGADRAPQALGNAGAMVVVLAVLAAATWLVNPYAAALLVPAMHAWLLILAPGVRLRRGAAIALLILGLLPVAGLVLADARSLGLGPMDSAWMAMLLVAGGHVGFGTWLLWSLFAAVAIGVGAIALRPPATPSNRRPEPDITVRGPLTYAGPGSLGGTESALRR
jgi:hypothetical protein